MTDPDGAVPSPRAVRLVRGGLELDGVISPVYAGAVHYFRLEPAAWRPCLEAVRDLGLSLVDLYVPWSVHEMAPGELDLGQRDARLDVVRFLTIADELGLRAIVRPGPHINAELTDFGIPHRVLWRAECQARSPAGHPLILPVPPRGFPVPSHASRAYLDEATRYLGMVGRALAPLCFPAGPIVAVQIDNEGALFFRDGAYEQDYHPDAVAAYRRFLQRRYAPDELGRRHGVDDVERIAPPVELDATDAAGLGRHLDWVEFQEQLVADAFGVFAEALGRAGMAAVPTTHNLPMGAETTPLCTRPLGEVVDLLGLDYYGSATERERAMHARRTTELVVRCEAREQPAFACEMGAGYPPYFPALAPEDSAFTVLTALAYGLRGFNVFMAVDRDRWIGAPIDRRGRPRPFADFWRRLVGVLRETGFHRLRRAVPVRLVVPRVERRLQRVLHAFGSVTAPMLNVVGAAPCDLCVEQDFGIGYPLVVGADLLGRRAAAALERCGVPFAWVAGEDGLAGLGDAAWVICATSGPLDGELRAALAEAARRGARLSVGPHPPAFDGAMQSHGEEGRYGLGATLELVAATDRSAIETWVAATVAELDLPRHRAIPESVRLTVHADEGGVPRVAFAINSGEAIEAARLELGTSCTARRWVDGLTGGTGPIDEGRIRLDLPARSAALLVLR